MHMADWIAKLDDFVRLSDNEVLQTAGSISHALAEEHANAEFERYQPKQRALADIAESDFDRAVKHLQAMDDSVPE
jgi:hypothetical protein